MAVIINDLELDIEPPQPPGAEGAEAPPPGTPPPGTLPTPQDLAAVDEHRARRVARLRAH